MSENWKEHFQGLSHIERLGLMRNPELSKQYLVALMEAPSGELNISRIEHAEILRAAAMNPALIGSSRRFGGESGGSLMGIPNSPFEQYGNMWELSVSKWMDQQIVPYFFLKFIQTTPDIKCATYNKLLAKGGDGGLCGRY